MQVIFHLPVLNILVGVCCWLLGEAVYKTRQIMGCCSSYVWMLCYSYWQEWQEYFSFPKELWCLPPFTPTLQWPQERVSTSASRAEYLPEWQSTSQACKVSYYSLKKPIPTQKHQDSWAWSQEPWTTTPSLVAFHPDPTLCCWSPAVSEAAVHQLS